MQSHLKAPFHSIYEIRKAGHRHLLPAASYLPAWRPGSPGPGGAAGRAERFAATCRPCGGTAVGKRLLELREGRRVRNPTSRTLAGQRGAGGAETPVASPLQQGCPQERRDTGRSARSADFRL